MEYNKIAENLLLGHVCENCENHISYVSCMGKNIPKEKTCISYTPVYPMEFLRRQIIRASGIPKGYFDKQFMKIRGGKIDQSIEV